VRQIGKVASESDQEKTERHSWAKKVAICARDRKLLDRNESGSWYSDRSHCQRVRGGREIWGNREKYEWVRVETMYFSSMGGMV
jgi:hypothetical protein